MKIRDVTIPSSSIKFHRTVAMDGVAPCSPIRLVQYDASIPIAAIKLTENSVPYTPPSSAAIRVRMHKPDGHGVYNDSLGFENGAVYFAFTQQMTAAFGNGYINIEISLPTGAVKYSDAIPVEIARNAVQQGQIESTDEWQSIDQILEQVKKLAQQAAASAQDAKQSETNAKQSETAAAQSAANSSSSATLSQSWAVGGTGTRQSEDTNNSKYFAQQAENFKNQAQDIKDSTEIQYRIDGDRVGFKRADENDFQYTPHLTGPQGPQGEQGIQGQQGPSGQIGPQGEAGATGPKGDKGDKGDKGQAGDRGDTGPQGPQGSTGPQGPQGVTGAKGEKGDRGEQGLSGSQGATGATGPQGPPGIQGPKGDKGDKGDRGENGVISKIDLGFFVMKIKSDGHLYIIHDEKDTPPALSINQAGHLIYATKE